MHMVDFAPGTVWLVGAGPGDPELLTRKAARLIAAADIVFYDALVGAAIVDALAPAQERVSVGKRSGRHSRDQATIDAMIVAAARAGKRVVRLKGGDPAVFGRTEEELAACRAAGIRVMICPGVTAASAAAAGAGTALTLRGAARRLTLVTAHLMPGQDKGPDWAALADPETTLAIYMGRAAAASVSRGLIAAGRSPATPVLVVVNASLPGERMIRGRLSSLAFLVETVSDSEPTMLLIGEALAAPATATSAARASRRSDDALAV